MTFGTGGTFGAKPGPFPRRENYGRTKLYIRASIDNIPEMEIRISSVSQIQFLDELVKHAKLPTCFWTLKILKVRTCVYTEIQTKTS